jgi:uncharacterized repeat protein (TIGR03803 family)
MPNLTVVAAFDAADGATPNGGLVADAAGDLFGVTSGGGASNDGVVYEVVKTSAATTARRSPWRASMAPMVNPALK